MDEPKDDNLKEIGSMLLKAGILLLGNGASTHRTRSTVGRISQAFGFTTEMMITNRAITLSISDKDNEHIYNTLKRASSHSVNFRIVSGVSRMSWRIFDEKWTVDQINTELDRLSALPHYPRLIVLSVVGLAGASLCRLFDGNIIEMLVTFIATFAGLFIRQEAVKKDYNPLLSVFIAAFTASFITALCSLTGISITMEHAFTACVLFLIPGVPLINSFSDLLDGNTVNGIVRGTNGLLIAFAIALGLLSTMIIFNL